MQPPDSTPGGSKPDRPPLNPDETTPFDPKEGFSDSVQSDEQFASEFDEAIRQVERSDRDRDAVMKDIIARILGGEPAMIVFGKPDEVPELSAFVVGVKDGQLCVEHYD